MRIATYNCNSIRVRLSAVMAWLDAYSPDVLALQETKATDADFPAAVFRDAGWQVFFRGEKSYNGVALVVKKEPEAVSFGFPGDLASGSRLSRIRINGVDVVNTYVPQGQALDSDKFSFKLEWFSRLKSYFSQGFDAEKSHLLWVGDLNVAPLPMDVYDSKAVWPHVCHCQEVIDAFQGVCSWGFVDIFRKHLPEPGNFTFWDYRQRDSLKKNRGWRIDHILATPALAEKSAACRVDMEPRKSERPSDHTFVYADFSI